VYLDYLLYRNDTVGMPQSHRLPRRQAMVACIGKLEAETDDKTARPPISSYKVVGTMLVVGDVSLWVMER